MTRKFKKESYFSDLLDDKSFLTTKAESPLEKEYVDDSLFRRHTSCFICILNLHCIMPCMTFEIRNKLNPVFNS